MLSYLLCGLPVINPQNTRFLGIYLRCQWIITPSFHDIGPYKCISHLFNGANGVHPSDCRQSIMSNFVGVCHIFVFKHSQKCINMCFIWLLDLKLFIKLTGVPGAYFLFWRWFKSLVHSNNNELYNGIIKFKRYNIHQDLISRCGIWERGVYM